MTALRNLGADLAAQLRMRGSLGRRLGLVLALQAIYVLARLGGMGREDSLNLGREKLARLGFMQAIVPFYHPDAGWIELDLYSAAYLTKQLLLDGAYEERPGFLPEPGQTVVDCGAHQGLFALRAAARVGPEGRVVAVEAYPPNAALLRRNALKARAPIVVVEAAALAQNGEIVLWVTEDVSGGQTTAPDVIPTAGRRPLRVPARRLDEILAEAGVLHPDLVKVDVEGAALEALGGASRALQRGPRLVVEVEGGPEQEARARDWLAARGYNVQIVGSILYAKKGAA